MEAVMEEGVVLLPLEGVLDVGPMPSHTAFAPLPGPKDIYNHNSSEYKAKKGSCGSRGRGDGDHEGLCHKPSCVLYIKWLMLLACPGDSRHQVLVVSGQRVWKTHQRKV